MLAAKAAAGWVIVTATSFVHPLASFAVTVYPPDVKPENVPLAW